MMIIKCLIRNGCKQQKKQQKIPTTTSEQTITKYPTTTRTNQTTKTPTQIKKKNSNNLLTLYLINVNNNMNIVNGYGME